MVKNPWLSTSVSTENVLEQALGYDVMALNQSTGRVHTNQVTSGITGLPWGLRACLASTHDNSHSKDDASKPSTRHQLMECRADPLTPPHPGS